jgi:tetratricopeptide (TPR) repeat protein
LDARVLRAQLLADTGQHAQAKSELDAVVASLPAAPSLETYLDLSNAFVELQNYDAALQLLKAAEQDYPHRAEVTTRLGETYTFARRWDDALAVWNGLLEIDPNDASAFLGKARVYNYSTHLADAEANYHKVLALEPNNYSALAELADVLARQSEYPDAIALYRQAIAQNPNNLKTRVELARVLRYDRQFAEAEAVTNDVIATDARYAPAYTERALARSGQGNDEAAITDARAALEITPNDLNAQLGLAEVLSYAERYDESIALYQAALARDPQNQKARVELGAALSYAGRYDEALAQANAVLKDNPQNVDAQIIRADTLARAGRTREAIAAYNTILQADSRNLRARVGLAEAYTYAQQYDNSLRVYDQLIATDPGNVAYKIAKGRTLSYARRYPQAVSTLRPVVAANPNNIQARLALAEAMTNSGNPGLRREAIGQYQTVLRSDAENTDARIGLGRAYSYSGKYNDADRELNAVLKTYPDNRDARFALAENQRFSGKPFDAQGNYERVLKTDATNVGARAGLLSVRRETAIAVTPAIRNFSDTNGVRLRSYSLGAVVPTRAGTIGVIGETGTYEDDGESRSRRALSLLLAKSFGPIQARLLLSRVNYGSAPSKTLYDLLVSRRTDARKRFYANIRKLDVIESLGAIDNGITDRQIRVGGEYPIARRFDLAVELIRHSYSDGNSRTSISPSLYYRVIDGQPQGKPVLRVGLGYQYDNTSSFSPFYYTPQDYKTFAILADYVKEQGRLRYGVYAAHPLSDSTGSGSGGPNRPSDTLFGFMNYDVNDVIELFVNGGVVRGPSYDSNEITAGATVRFH